MTPQLLQLTDDSSSGGGVLGATAVVVIGLGFLVLILASYWKIWAKMGDPGWMGIVPVFNLYRVFVRSRPENAVLLTILSIFCFIGGLIALADLARLFGKGIGYVLGLIFLPIVFVPMLAFGSAQYQGPRV